MIAEAGEVIGTGTGMYSFNDSVQVGDAFVPGCALVNPIGVIFTVLEGEQADKFLEYMEQIENTFTPDGAFQTVEDFQSWVIQGYDETQREDAEYPQEF